MGAQLLLKPLAWMKQEQLFYQSQNFCIKRITKNAFLCIVRATTGYDTRPKLLLAPMGSLLWRYSCEDTAFCYLADRMSAQPTFKFCLFKKPSVCSSPDGCEINLSDVGGSLIRQHCPVPRTILRHARHVTRHLTVCAENLDPSRDTFNYFQRKQKQCYVK